MIEKAFMTLSNKRLKRYLQDELGYSEKKARQTISALRKMEPCILEAFLIWFYRAKFPGKPLHGIHVKALCDKRGLDPVTAFLTADWAAREPQAARKALSTGHDTLRFGPEEEKNIQEIMEQNRWELKEQEITENEDDLTINREKNF